jgi:hypothetical protein
MATRLYKDRYSASELKAAPERLVEITTTEKLSIDRQTLADIQLTSLTKRFDDLIDRVPILHKFAEDQGVKSIQSFEDAGLLLFPHTVYKSYPLAILEHGRYDQLTRWLNNLTMHDLSGVDARGCETLDDWLLLLDRTTDLRLKHSSGTTGKLSFIPRSQSEMFTVAMGWRRFFEGFGDEPDAVLNDVEDLPMVLVYWRYGAMAVPRMVDAVVQYLYGGDESRVLCANPTRVSADMLSLGGRVRAAEAKGQLGRMQISPALAVRREKFIKEQAETAERQRAFFNDVMARMKDQRIVLYTLLPQLFEIARDGLRDGISDVFAANSLALVGGGAKGHVFPEDFREMIAKFLGMPFPREGYGMSEMVTGATRMCPHAHYHFPPNIVPFLLDPETGAQKPRTGWDKGRFGFVDIATQTHWGGFLSGDEVILHWGDTTPCPCGRKGAYIERTVQRYSEKNGGDDKITCAGAPDMLNRALDFLSQAN